jgi:hypothetical protein
MFDNLRLDVDEAMARAQQVHGRRDIEIWNRIASDLNQGGPFAALLTQFREGAVAAMSDLIYADPNDAVRVAALQADVRRCLDTMEHIDAFQNAAEAADANIEADSASDED